MYYSEPALWLMGAAGMCAGIPIGFCVPAAWGWVTDRVAPRPLDTGLPTSGHGFARRRIAPASVVPKRRLKRGVNRLLWPDIDLSERR